MWQKGKLSNGDMLRLDKECWIECSIEMYMYIILSTLVFDLKYAVFLLSLLRTDNRIFAQLPSIYAD